MSQIDQLEVQLARALDRLREAISTSERVASGSDVEPLLQARVTSLENDKARLLEELVGVRSKRDEDVAALDALISQLKPLIEEEATNA
ncbi:hypothetical protein [Amaricoccus tamworthensis]|uniref:hypothetical protein n=1 Tax=Amaricoccus tamworthensis TaxID=57002 RepID=UPI003C7DE21D